MKAALFESKGSVKKLMAVLLVFGFILGAFPMVPGQATADAKANTKVSIDGKTVKFDVAPRVIRGTMMVPLRGATENLGGKATWDKKTRTITATKDSVVLKMTVGSKVAYISGKKTALTVAPIIVRGHTLVPLRFISEGFGYQVHWSGATKTMTISKKGTPGGVVNIYTSRHYGVEPVFAEFTKETGIRVRFTSGPDALLRERIKAEGKNTPADIYMTVDAGNLWLAAQDGLLQSVNSSVLKKNIPENLRDDKDRWFGLTKRVRTIMYNPKKVKASELSTYEDLANPEWKGRLILRPGTHVYTQSLVANLIATYGPERAEKIVKGWMANEPKFIDSDSRILETLAAGGGDVAITNHYYLGRLLEKDPSFPIKVLWAEQDRKGVHANISGAGVTTHADNKENAIRLLEWLSGAKGQKLFADTNHEYPTNPKLAPHSIIAKFGGFKEDSVDKSEFGRLQADAVKLLEKVGYK
ncbi:MAG: extracellular solute-binding protein [Actinobacteria bacterium]|nr:extracellular solute-binding protein [Actinomycetota bacterium]